ncbi:AGE family epimerase/isomerase [uncultured Dysgonomonas sp.]|uniref:Cellobiose 2-epimerase n=1 Tax=uncultured Dysgonomonas sp. TaxID=206096 RepID=A0A212K674_9BACT|nr:AGE family epimerase/isomerase [uncultured Dysgonomonas sp.]SBW07005.1 Cellobiose 2-epimerase [uncultured Dysgonomonas sp.]
MKSFKDELQNNILPFWIHKMTDNQNEGFFGQIDGENHLHPHANKGAVLNARILWTFSAAYRILGNTEYMTMAHRAFAYIKKYFIDHEYGGVYWELDYLGKPVNTKKQVYAQGFVIYGLSEYYRITRDDEALQLAQSLFYLLEKHKDKENGGYFEAFTREWQPIEDMRLSEKDANEKKSMNTHLHILEPYTNLLRVWNNVDLKEAHKAIIDIFINKIVDHRTYHQHLFFDEQWTVKSTPISYGHDIEAAWLLYEAAQDLNDEEAMQQVSVICLKIADAASEGLQSDGSMIYEKDNNHIDTDRHWWVQAEGVVGYMYAYKISQDEQYRQYAEKLWAYIQNNISDKTYGEWIWSRNAKGAINRKEDKAGFWKCPYHNSRMCLEMIENFNLI